MRSQGQDDNICASHQSLLSMKPLFHLLQIFPCVDLTMCAQWNIFSADKSEVSTVGPSGEEASDQMVSCAHLTLLLSDASEQSEVGTGNHLVLCFLTT